VHVIKVPQKDLRNLGKSTLWIERLNWERELDCTLSGRKFHAFAMRLLKKVCGVRETWGLLNNLYWWPLVEAYVVETKKNLSWRRNDAKHVHTKSTCDSRLSKCKPSLKRKKLANPVPDPTPTLSLW